VLASPDAGLTTVPADLARVSAATARRAVASTSPPAVGRPAWHGARACGGDAWSRCRSGLAGDHAVLRHLRGRLAGRVGLGPPQRTRHQARLDQVPPAIETNSDPVIWLLGFVGRGWSR
jgi:hypothetical protein